MCSSVTTGPYCWERYLTKIAGVLLEKFDIIYVLTQTTTTTTFNGLFSRTTWVSQYQKGKTSLDLKEERDGGVLGWQWHRQDHMQTICTSLHTENHNTSSLNFYKPDAVPDAQPTV